MGAPNENAAASKNARTAEFHFLQRVNSGESPETAVQQEINELRALNTSKTGQINVQQLAADVKAFDRALTDYWWLPHVDINDDSDAAPTRRTYSQPRPESDKIRDAGPAESQAPARRSYSPGHSRRRPEVERPAVVPEGDPADHKFDRPQESANDHGTLPSLKSAIDRAKNGGRPLSIVQIGDSHVAMGSAGGRAGYQTTALAERLAADTGLAASQIRFGSIGDVGKTAEFASQHPEEFLRTINPSTDLVVVSFGSNEAGALANSAYVASYDRLVHMIRQRAPNAAIVMAGPPDGNFWNSGRHLPGIDSVVDAQKGVQSATADSSYIDVRTAEPRFASVSGMRRLGLMSTDNLHLTREGYRLLGGTIADYISERL